MSDYDRNIAAAPFGRTMGQVGSVAVDEGLRAYMLRIYNYMALGLAITGCAALGIYMLSVTGEMSAAAKVLRAGAEVPARIGNNTFLTPIGYFLFASYMKWVVMLAPLALVFVLGFGIERMRPATAQILFWIYAGLVGVSLATVFMVFTQTSVVRVFFITAASFGALSLYGYTTQRDLSPMGSFLIMGLFGIIIASLVNLFLHSSGLQWVISVLGVGIFAGLTAYDTQRIKEMYSSAYDDGTIGRMAVMGALSLYLDFINLFLYLLRFMGDRR